MENLLGNKDGQQKATTGGVQQNQSRRTMAPHQDPFAVYKLLLL